MLKMFAENLQVFRLQRKKSPVPVWIFTIKVFGFILRLSSDHLIESKSS